jgi:hypothetical protein
MKRTNLVRAEAMSALLASICFCSLASAGDWRGGPRGPPPRPPRPPPRPRPPPPPPPRPPRCSSRRPPRCSRAPPPFAVAPFAVAAAAAGAASACFAGFGFGGAAFMLLGRAATPCPAVALLHTSARARRVNHNDSFFSGVCGSHKTQNSSTLSCLVHDTSNKNNRNTKQKPIVIVGHKQQEASGTRVWRAKLRD